MSDASQTIVYGEEPELSAEEFLELARSVWPRELVWQRSPTGLFFGAQEGNEGFFEKLGFVRSMTAFARKKPRPTSAS